MSLSEPADIAVVIVNYNGGKFIQRCLESLTKQRVAPRRIVVVENGSEDGSGDWLRDNAHDVEVISLPSNVGFAAANNCAFSEVSDCTWVALLNPDTETEPDWIERLVKSTVANPEVSMFSCRLVSLGDPDTLDGTGDHYHVSGLGWRRDHGADATRRREVEDPVFSPCAAAAMYRFDALQEAGGFDESYFCYNEDTDLGFRMRLRGATCVHLDDCVVHHAGSGITGSSSDFTVYHGHRNLVWTFFRNMPTRLLWRYLPEHLLLNLVSILTYTLRGRPGVMLRAKRDALRGLPAVLRQRKAQRALLGRKNAENIESLHNAMVRGLLKPYFGRRS